MDSQWEYSGISNSGTSLQTVVSRIYLPPLKYLYLWRNCFKYLVHFLTLVSHSLNDDNWGGVFCDLVFFCQQFCSKCQNSDIWKPSECYHLGSLFVVWRPAGLHDTLWKVVGKISSRCLDGWAPKAVHLANINLDTLNVSKIISKLFWHEKMKRDTKEILYYTKPKQFKFFF